MEKNKQKVLILCGGIGARMREETEFRPKPLVHVGNKPILWHIMMLFSYFDHKDFVLCLGYKGDLIKEYFLKFNALNNDFTIDLNGPGSVTCHGNSDLYDWKVTLADTGNDTPTGGRIKMVEKYIDTEQFFVVYGDGLSDININSLFKDHMDNGMIGTMTGVHPISRYGVIDHENDRILSFTEKPLLEGFINGGFFVFNKEVFEHLSHSCVLETDTIPKLIKLQRINLYKHCGYWRSIDTFKDAQALNRSYYENIRPWMIWNKT